MLDLNLFENKFTEIQFDESTHTYRIKDNENYISVTTLIGLYCNDFDSDKAVQFSLKRPENKGKTKEDILQTWEDKAEKASVKGSNVHSYIEGFLKGKINKKTDNQYSKEYEYFHNFYDFFMKDKKLIYSEKVMYMKQYRLAGTIDCMVYCPEEDILYFIDWKTNEKISYENKYAKLKPPLQSYEQSSKNIYALQISLYRYIIENTILNNYPLPNMKNLLVHISNSNQNFQVHELPYYKYSVIQLLKHYQSTKEQK